ncbi:MAG: adenine phosphoribosyltransferase [Kiritimatiellaeota bacterium]|nr:adenine phosphoribosyltransferase [Kiritimatiellota bacterium]
MNADALKQAIRDVPDFPKPGILFKDITPVLSDPKLFRVAVNLLADRHAHDRIDKIAVIEARGFTFGTGVALKLGVGLALIRKPGKLPGQTISASYELEYGSATLHTHTDAILPGERVLLVDDLLATGGTAAATAGLIEKLGGEIVEIEFLIELAFLKGREKLTRWPVYAPVVF